MSELKADLLAAYAATNFQVFVDQLLTMKIEQPNAELRALLVSATVQTACFLTACNPRSQLVSNEANSVAMKALEGELNAAGLTAR